LSRRINALDALTCIQRHTSTPVLVPDFTGLPAGQVDAWRFAAKILSGEDATRTYPEGHCLVLALDAAITEPEGTFAVSVPWTVDVGAQRIDLGRVEVWLTDSTLLERTERDGVTYHAFTTPDRTVCYHASA
jgi:hypothetical protein